MSNESDSRREPAKERIGQGDQQIQARYGTGPGVNLQSAEQPVAPVNAAGNTHRPREVLHHSSFAIRHSLLTWYDTHRRDLPWRASGDPPDPYRVWLSEVMLQQTRVETVRGYYQRWVERFPTLESLAQAPLDEVLKAWEGLGYYARARNFHRAVREVAAHHGGRVPREPTTLRALPGVGRYTAGAVTSIAYGQPAPVVDGNVRRVFARWLDEPKPSDAALWALAEALVAGDRPGDLNQALMELGATVCTPRSPRCDICAVQRFCASQRAGTQADRPARKPAKPLPHEEIAVALVERGREFLLTRRPVEARLGGMWEFPGAIRQQDETTAAAAERSVREGLGVTARGVGEVGVIAHAFSHVRVTYRAIRFVWISGEPRALGWDAWAWVAPRDLHPYALPTAQKKIAALLGR